MSEVKPVIKTAEERMQEWTAATELGSFIQLSAAQFRFYLSQEVKELRAALEALQADHKENYLLLQEALQENEEQAKRIAELERELTEWNEFKKIRDSQMAQLRKQFGQAQKGTK